MDNAFLLLLTIAHSMKQEQLNAQAYFWALQGLYALHRKPFSIELAQQQSAAPYTNEALLATLEH
jgi:ATP-binding cassette, subfamily B, bacterial HlyB/CyaB